jgi:hypothetical protein
VHQLAGSITVLVKIHMVLCCRYDGFDELRLSYYFCTIKLPNKTSLLLVLHNWWSSVDTKDGS